MLTEVERLSCLLQKYYIETNTNQRWPILPNALKYFKLILIVLSFFIGGSYIGRKAQNKGYLEGIKIAVVSIVILFLLSYAGFGNKPNLSLLIYYLIIFLSCIFGSIIGINKSKKEN